jgi:hypothetical protein
MPIPRPVLIAMIAATVATLLIALGGFAWWSGDGLDWFRGQGIGVLAVPALAAFIVALGFIWYRLFSAVLDLLGERDDG